MSRRHFQLRNQDGVFFVTDLDSTNGRVQLRGRWRGSVTPHGAIHAHTIAALGWPNRLRVVCCGHRLRRAVAGRAGPRCAPAAPNSLRAAEYDAITVFLLAANGLERDGRVVQANRETTVGSMLTGAVAEVSAVSDAVRRAPWPMAGLPVPWA